MSAALNATAFGEFLSSGLEPLLAASGQSFFWDNIIFKKNNWVGAMFVTRVTLCLLTALLLIWEVRAWRMGVKVGQNKRKWIAIILAVAAFGTYFDFGNEKVRYKEYYHRHEFYHYYLGSKYSEELGYTRLYECTLVAETDNGRGAAVRRREFRDLTVNLIKPATETNVVKNPDNCRKRFTEERWEAFKKDVGWFERSARGSYWERMQQDHGYNPPPVWTMGGKFFANLHPADDAFFKWLSLIDIGLQAGMVLLLYWAFGARVAAVGAVFWGCNAAANFYWTGGAFLRQDWMFMLVASVTLARKRFFFWAGFALMYSALLRAFPAALFGGWAVMVAAYTWRRIQGKPPAAGDEKRGVLSYIHPSHRRIIAGAFVALAVLVPASMKATEGVQAWKEFAEHIQVHKDTPLTNHMGLPTILSHTWEGRMRFTRNANLDDAFQEWKEGRNERKHDLRYTVQFPVFFAFWLWIAWATKNSYRMWIGPALSLPLVMCLTDLTCYYYSMYIIAAVLVAARREVGIGLLATGAASVVLLGRSIGYAGTNISGFYYVDDNFTAQSYLFLIFSMLMLWTYSRPFSLKALREWLGPWRPHKVGSKQSQKAKAASEGLESVAEESGGAPAASDSKSP